MKTTTVAVKAALMWRMKMITLTLVTSVYKHVTARAAILEITRRSEIDFSIVILH